MTTSTKETSGEFSSPSKATKGSYSSYVSPQNTVILLDWDDTLMCTTFFSLKKDPLSEKEKNYIEYLGQKVTLFLTECKKFGKVIILTNSTMVWVNSSSEKLLKINKEILKDILIISARDKYSKIAKSKSEWKKLALAELFQEKKNYAEILNLLCVSDSYEDIRLFKSFKRTYSDWMKLSTVKLQLKPSPLVMMKEIQFMTKNLEKVIGNSHNYYLDNGKDKEKENKNNENIKTLFSLSLFGI